MPLAATITSPQGRGAEETETFTILSGATVIGAPVTVDVSGGAASASYALPAGTPPGTYTIQAEFSGTTNFNSFTDRTSHSLVINAAASATAAASASATFNVGSVHDHCGSRRRHELGWSRRRGDRDVHDPERLDAHRLNPLSSTSPPVPLTPAISCRRGHPVAPTPSRPSTAAAPTSSGSPTPATPPVIMLLRHRHRRSRASSASSPARVCGA